jgi:hypothetical protein
MTERFGVEPDRLGVVSAGVGERGSRANPVLSAARAQIAAEGRAGGGGVLGRGFAHGLPGFGGQWATVAGWVGARAVLVDSYAQRRRYAWGRFRAIGPGGGLGYLIVGSPLVMGLSHGSRVFSVRGVDGDGEAVAAVTVLEMK